MLWDGTKYFTLLLLFLLYGFLWVESVAFGNGLINHHRMVGGSCTYSQYYGQAKIESVSLKLISGKHARKYYEIFFIFQTDDEIPALWQHITEKPQLLIMKNGKNPSVDFVNSHNIQAGDTYNCILNIISKGACTPIIFEIPELNI